jgi:hypothetical protein
MPAGYPTIRPLKVVDFANQTLVDSTFSFSRSTAGSFVNSSGLLVQASANQPKFQHDPLGGYLGLLLEGQSTNVLPWSNNILASGWYYPAFNGAVSSGYLGVDGQNNTFRIAEGNIPNNFYISNAHTLNNPSYIAPSAFVKSDGISRGYLQLAAYNSSGVVVGNAVVYFNLARREVYPENYGTSSIAALIEPWKNDWFRIGVIGPVSSGATLGVLNLFLQDDDGSLFYPGRGRGLLVDGFQVEVAASTANPMISSFIATSGAAATRAVDVLASAGALFAQWYSASGQTIYQEAIVDSRDFLGNGRASCRMRNTVAGHSVEIREVGGRVQANLLSGNTLIGFVGTSFGDGLNAWENPSSGNGSARPLSAHCAFSFSSSGSTFVYNGLYASGLASAFVPSGINELEITPITGGKKILRRFALYPLLPSDQLLLITRP